MKKTNLRYRHIARVVVEATTPIAVGSGMLTVMTDAPVVRDINGLPYIPATSLTGVLRHSMALGKLLDETNFFGYQDRNGGLGARIVFTDAVMIGKNGIAVDGIQTIDFLDNFYNKYLDLPVRNHVSIDYKGVHKDTGKFDNEVVYKGTRFVFEVELCSDKENDADFEMLLTRLYQNSIRVGGGSRKGYGRLTVVSCKCASLDLMKAKDLSAYIEKSSRLDSFWEYFVDWTPDMAIVEDKEWTTYLLKLTPRDFFLFGAGHGDEEADNISAQELVVEWHDGKPAFSVQRTLVPASSLKGALAHRTAYNYNKQNNLFVGNDNAKTLCKNPAVAAIFGYSDDDVQTRGKCGNIIFDDILDATVREKLFSHIKSDSFTGGTIDGALFQEKSIYGQNLVLEEEILVRKDVLADETIKKAFEQSLKDLCCGLLPIGGCVGRGNGFFTGEIFKDGGKL